MKFKANPASVLPLVTSINISMARCVVLRKLQKALLPTRARNACNLHNVDP